MKVGYLLGSLGDLVDLEVGHGGLGGDGLALGPEALAGVPLNSLPVGAGDAQVTHHVLRDGSHHLAELVYLVPQVTYERVSLVKFTLQVRYHVIASAQVHLLLGQLALQLSHQHCGHRHCH